MAILNLASSIFYPFKFSIINTILLTVAILSFNYDMGMADIGNKSTNTIEGQSGGSIDSQGCGFIAANPNHQMSLKQRIDYMRLTVQADGGQPTLLVLGPNSGDSFCVLGDEISGLKPEISGVWEPGSYQIFIGDRSGKQHQFVLDISTEN